VKIRAGILVSLVFAGVAGGCSGAPGPAADGAGALAVDGMVFRRISPKAYGIPGSDFYLLETEVTNEQYLRFLLGTNAKKDEAPTPPDPNQPVSRRPVSEEDKIEVYLVDRQDLLWVQNRPPAGFGDSPVSMVRMKDAQAFCSWLNGRHPEVGTFRLPTEKEWVTAAYGAGRLCPWGAGDADLKSYVRAVGPEPVRQHPEFRTPEGLYGMWGNVSEFVQVPRRPDLAISPNLTWARWVGGSYADPDLAPQWDRRGSWIDPDGRSQRVGFRVLLEPRS
jgi:formylglycine-generating enzyme required for sulfatase activity